MNRRHTDRMPSPAFRFFVYVALAALVVFLSTIFASVANAAAPRAVAPVLERQGTDGVRKQIGWFTYERMEGRVVLYCVPEGDTTLTCAVYVQTPKGNAVVLVDGIVATEVAS